MSLFIRIINILFLHSKSKFYLMFILLFFAAIIESIGIGLVLPIVDIINTETNTVKISNFEFEKKKFLIYIFLFFIFKFFLLIGIYFLQSKYVYNIQAFFSKLLFKKYLSLSLVKQKQQNTNVISRNIYNEVNEFAQISNILISTINEIIILLGIFILFILFLPNQIILTSLLLFIISIFFIKFLSNAIKKIGSKRQEFDGKRLIVINEAFKGIKEIISFGIKNIFIDKYSSHNYRVQESSKMFKAYPRISIEFIVVIPFLIFISLNLNDEILNGKKILPIVALVGVSMLRMLPSINKIIVGANQINYGKAIIQVIEEGIKNKDQKDLIKLNKFKENFKSITFENVNFSYNEKKIIKNLNLKINLGDKIGIMGKSGSGKTTIIDLLMGMLKPDGGCIYLINKI